MTRRGSIKAIAATVLLLVIGYLLWSAQGERVVLHGTPRMGRSHWAGHLNDPAYRAAHGL